MTCELSSDDAPPGTSVTLDLFLEDAVDVQGYQATIQITRTQGNGEVTVACPDGLTVDESRGDFIFSGLDTVYLEPDCPDCGVIVPHCEGLRVAAARVAGGVDTGATRAYLGTFTLDMSADATPGSRFDISIAPFPASIVTGSDYESMPLSIGPSCTLTDDGGGVIPTVSEWGLIVLALLLLTGMKVWFGRHGHKIPNVGGATAGHGGSALRALVLVLALAGAPSAALGKECYRHADCDDNDKCTLDECVNRHCRYTPVKPYGDIASADWCVPDGRVDEYDVSTIEAAARDIFDEGCSPHNMDIKSAAGYQADGEINLFDINAVLSAFAGELTDQCKPTGACCTEQCGCMIATSAECDASGGVYQGDGTDCDTGIEVEGDESGNLKREDEALCIRTPLGPGQVEFIGCTAAQLEQYAVIPEDGTNLTTPVNGAWYDTDGFYWGKHAPCDEWYKIGNHCDTTITCTGQGGFTSLSCCNLCASIFCGTPGWTDDDHNTDNPFCSG
ncbi:MAG: IPTL-CTERM sorting domain-containing protein [Phycisphaerales bacterium]|nr:MAG: IPTL-CTERM sorting domain-containing protein [Phycisphaerales bacterium]